MYFGRRDQKTTAYRDWEVGFLHELRRPEPQAALKDLREAFVLHTHAYRARIIWYTPRASFLTKEGNLSNRTFDVTNVEKPIIDLIFLPKYHVQPVPYGCKNLNVDDKQLLSLTSGKRCSAEEKYEIEITIWIEELKKYV